MSALWFPHPLLIFASPLFESAPPRTLFLVYSYLESILFQIKVFYPQIKHSPPPPHETEPTPLYPSLRGGPFASTLKAEKETLCGRLHYSRLCYVHIAAICMLQLRMGLHMLWKQLHMLPFPHQLLFRKVVQIVSDTYLIVNANKVTSFQIKEHVYGTLGFYSTLYQLLLMLVFKDKSTYKFTKE